MSAASSSGGGAGVPHLDIDPFSIAFFDDLHPAQEALREAGPLVYLDKWKIYGVARHAEVHAVLNDPATFCSSRGVGLSDFARRRHGVPRASFSKPIRRSIPVPARCSAMCCRRPR